MTASVYPPLRPLSRAVFHRVFAAPNEGSIVDWADRHRYLSPEATNTPSPMRWETTKVPYARQIMQDLTDPEIHHVCFVKPRQVAGTEIINNWVGHTIDWAPSPMLVIQPTETVARNWSKERLSPLIRDCPTLRPKVRDGSRRRTRDDSLDRKAFDGGYIAVVSAKSTAQLRMRPAGKIAYDERDESEEDLGGQGDPLEILKGATATFWDWKLFEVSTPLDWYTSPIWGSWKSSDQHLYHVPCPYCNGAQVLVWRDGEGESATPEGGDRYRLVCEKDEQGELIPESARYQCAHCERLIEERWKRSMMAEGQWVPQVPGRREIRGYRIGGLYSFLAWAEIIRRFNGTKRIPAKLKTFVNLTLGLPYREEGERVEPHYLQLRAESYGEGVDLPMGVAVVVFGVDVQGDRLEVGVWAVGPEDQWWLVGQYQLDGDPAQPEVWHTLGAMLAYGWRHASGRTVTVAAVSIDAAYQTDRVHAFAAKHHRPERPVIATIGRDGRGRPILTAPPKAQKWQKGKGSRPKPHIMGTDAAKDAWHSALRLQEPGPGYVHFPDQVYRTLDDEVPIYSDDKVFFEQLTAEELKTVYVNGRPTRRWALKEEGRRNEALDCANHARVANARLGPKVQATYKTLAELLAIPPDKPASLPTPAVRTRGRIRSRGLE
jgi:phage terminase large subunit GpA-like protein